MGVGLVSSLQPPDILWIHWRVYNSFADTSKGVLFLPPSDVYVRSFLNLLYTLIRLYYAKALSDPASSLALDWILLLRRPRTLTSLRDSAITFHKQPRCSSIGECINKLWYIQAMEYSSALKKNRPPTHEKTWRKCKCILLLLLLRC